MEYRPDCEMCENIDPPAPVIPPVYDPPSGECCVPKGGNPGQVLTKASGADLDMIWADGGSGGGGTLLHPSTATKTVGGVTAGTTIPAGTSFEELFKWILAPAMNPTLTNPSATLTSNLPRTIYGFDEVIGNVTFNLSFNRGSISPAYGTDGYRSGPATSYAVDGRDGQRVVIDMDVKLPSGSAGKATITGVVGYSAGQQPKDSQGNDYGSALQAGSVTSNGIEVERKYYVYSTKDGTFDRLPIEQYNSSPTDIYLAHLGPHGIEAKIAFPSRATKIEVYNDVTSQWQDDSREFPETTQTIDGITYYVYTDNRPYGSAARRLRFTW